LTYGGKVKLAKMNVDEHPSIAGQLRIQGLPTVYAFVDGRPVDGFQGALPETGIHEFIARLIGPDAEAELAAALTAADDAMTAGDLQAAAEIYAAILQESAEEPAALAGLAKCYLTSGDVDRADQTLSLVPPDSRKLPTITAVAAQAARRRYGRAGSQGCRQSGRSSGADRPCCGFCRDGQQRRRDRAVAHQLPQRPQLERASCPQAARSIL
jgi:putative thioredoxin